MGEQAGALMPLSPRSADHLAELAKALDIPAAIEFAERYGNASKAGSIGAALRRLRRAASPHHAKSMQEVSDATGINMKTLAAYEIGYRGVPPAVLGELLDYYGSSYSKFFAEIAQREPACIDEARRFPLDIPAADEGPSRTEFKALGGMPKR